MAEAEADAAEIRAGADDYAASVLHRIYDDLNRTIQSVQKGIAMLDQRQPEPELATADEGDGFDDYKPEDEPTYR